MKNSTKTQATTASTTNTRPAVQPLHTSSRLLVDADTLGVTLSGQKVLDDVSFCIHSGEFIGLIGPNGAGKTTLLKSLLGLGPVTDGRIRTDKSRIGYIPQRGSADSSQVPISVREVVQLGCASSAPCVAEALEQVGMADLINRRFRKLSGGQQQRVLIAKALATRPNLLILDEPTAGIDEPSQAEFYRLLGQLHSSGMTVIMVSHDIDTVLKLVTRVICLNRSIVYDGPPEHFEADRYMPSLYGKQHRLLHHQHHGADHV